MNSVATPVCAGVDVEVYGGGGAGYEPLTWREDVLAIEEGGLTCMVVLIFATAEEADEGWDGCG